MLSVRNAEAKLNNGMETRVTESFALTSFVVDYFATTPSGSSTRFQRSSGISQLRAGAHSETAVLFYLKRLHPGCEITIVDLEFR